MECSLQERRDPPTERLKVFTVTFLTETRLRSLVQFWHSTTSHYITNITCNWEHQPREKVKVGWAGGGAANQRLALPGPSTRRALSPEHLRRPFGPPGTAPQGTTAKARLTGPAGKAKGARQEGGRPHLPRGRRRKNWVNYGVTRTDVSVQLACSLTFHSPLHRFQGNVMTSALLNPVDRAESGPFSTGRKERQAHQHPWSAGFLILFCSYIWTQREKNQRADSDFFLTTWTECVFHSQLHWIWQVADESAAYFSRANGERERGAWGGGGGCQITVWLRKQLSTEERSDYTQMPSWCRADTVTH